MSSSINDLNNIVEVKILKEKEMNSRYCCILMRLVLAGRNLILQHFIQFNLHFGTVVAP